MNAWLSGLAQNLVASAIAGAIVWAWAHRHIRRLHARIDGLHDHLDEMVGDPQGEHAATQTFPAVGGDL